MQKRLISNNFEAICFGLLTAFLVLIVFFKTFLSGEPISRLDLLYQLDVLYNSELTGVSLAVSQDPSTPLQSFPKEWYLQKCIWSGQAPTWNALLGAGTPLIADLSNSLLNPIDLIIGVGNQPLYNSGIVLKILVAAVCTYIVYVRRGASTWASSIGALSYCLFAKGLRIAELAETFLGTPIVFLAFSFLDKKSFRSCMNTSLILAFAYYSMHPEGFFVSVVAAASLWLVESIWTAESNDEQKPKKALQSDELTKEESIFDEKIESSCSPEYRLKNRAFQALSMVSFTGIATICLVAASLFSFVEFLKLAYSYKYTAQTAEYLRLDQIPFFLTIAKIQYSLFPGIVTLVGLPACFFALKKNAPSLLFLVVWVLFESRPGVLANIFSQAPLSFLLPEYTFSAIMMLLCWLSSSGLTNLATSRYLLKKLSILSLSLILIMVPLLLAKIGIPTREYQNLVTPKMFLLTISMVVISGTGLVLIAKPRLKAPIALLLTILNVASMWAGIKKELPATRPVNFPPPEHRQLIEELVARKDSRIIACGDRLLQPNTSLIYGLSDFRMCSPMIHEKYLNFVKAAGGNLGYCNMIQFPRALSHLIDLASIKFILTDSPLRSADQQSLPEEEAVNDKRKPLADNAITGRILPGLRLVDGRIYEHPSEAAFEINLLFSNYLEVPERYQIQLLLIKEDGTVLWKCPYQLFSTNLDKAHRSSTFKYLVPAPINGLRSGFLCMSILDAWTQLPIKPDGKMLATNSAGIILKSVEQLAPRDPNTISSADNRFKLVFEGKNLLRIYQNETALPDAYFVDKIRAVGSDAEALAILTKEKLNKTTAVVVGKEISLGSTGKLNHSTDTIRLIHRDNNSQLYACKSTEKFLVVQTQLFYPGWNAYIDGKRSTIHRANAIFRAVQVPAGEHTVHFKYESPVILAGNALSLLTLVIFGALTFRASKTRN